jgi:1,4-alpha-glucan branching enzyme
MIALSKAHGLFGDPDPVLLHENGEEMVIAFYRKQMVFAFNFHPTRSFVDYRINAPAGKYRMLLDSDQPDYDGHNRLRSVQDHFTRPLSGEDGIGEVLSLYLPSRTAVVLQHL